MATKLEPTKTSQYKGYILQEYHEFVEHDNAIVKKNVFVGNRYKVSNDQSSNRPVASPDKAIEQYKERMMV